MRRGVRLGVDAGTARIGVARSDPEGLLAVPLETVHRRRGDRWGHLDRLLELIAEYEAVEVLVGDPVALSGAHTASTGQARRLARLLAERTRAAVRLVDERLTTVTAGRQLRELGRSASRSRDRIDRMAAVVLLQNALDAERSTGQPPGTAVARRREDPGYAQHAE